MWRLRLGTVHIRWKKGVDSVTTHANDSRIADICAVVIVRCVSEVRPFPGGDAAPASSVG